MGNPLGSGLWERIRHPTKLHKLIVEIVRNYKNDSKNYYHFNESIFVGNVFGHKTYLVWGFWRTHNGRLPVK